MVSAVSTSTPAMGERGGATKAALILALRSAWKPDTSIPFRPMLNRPGPAILMGELATGTAGGLKIPLKFIGSASLLPTLQGPALALQEQCDVVLGFSERNR